GDLSEVRSLRDSDPARAAVTSTRENCLGSSCPSYSRCHVVAARREAQAADVVVVNHHLLLADLAMKDEGFGELLPGAEAVILDEAHQVPEIAAQFFGRDFSGRQATRRAAKLAETLESIMDTGADAGLRWAEATRGAFTLAFTPFEVAPRLGELMRAQGGAWIFTSATLAIGEDFSHFLGRIGAPAAQSVRIESPFDFESQAQIYLPKGLPDPASPGYTSRVVEAALPLIEAAGGRSFLLFTSHR